MTIYLLAEGQDIEYDLPDIPGENIDNRGDHLIARPIIKHLFDIFSGAEVERQICSHEAELSLC